MSEPEEIDYRGNFNRLVEKIDSIQSSNKEILRELEKMQVGGWKSWRKGVILAFLGMTAVPGAGMVGAGARMLSERDGDGTYLIIIGSIMILSWCLFAWIQGGEISKAKRKTNPK